MDDSGDGCDFMGGGQGTEKYSPFRPPNEE